MDELDYKALLDAIDPRSLNYAQWIRVGMALRAAGQDVSLWDEWSRRDGARYHAGECERKWRSFDEENVSAPVRAGTLVQMARENGWRPNPGRRGTGLGCRDRVGRDGRPRRIFRPRQCSPCRFRSCRRIDSLS